MSVDVLINGRYPLVMPPHRAEQWAKWTGGWERERLDSMHEHLKPGTTLYSIGAEEGDFEALFATWGCDVVCVEPSPWVWPNIRAHFELNGVEPLGCVVGVCAAVEGRHYPTMNLRGFPNESMGVVVPNRGFRTLHETGIETTTIDYIASCFAPPDAITMDVEGAELLVLMGAERTLAEHRPLVWISEHPDFARDYGYDMSDLHAWMFDRDYRGTLLAIDHEEHWIYVPKERA